MPSRVFNFDPLPPAMKNNLEEKGLQANNG